MPILISIYKIIYKQKEDRNVIKDNTKGKEDIKI